MEKKQQENKIFISQFAFSELKRMFEKQKAELMFLRNENKMLREKSTKIIVKDNNPLCSVIC